MESDEIMDDLEKNKCIESLINEASRELESKGSLSHKVKNLINKNVLRRNILHEDMIRWPKGILLLGLSSTESTDVICDYFDRWIESGAEVISLEDVLAGQVMLKIAIGSKNNLAGICNGHIENEAKSDKACFYIKYCEKIASFLGSYERDAEGSLPYNVKVKNEHIYADSIGMICPFLMMYGIYTGDQKYVDMAFIQIDNFMKNAMDEAKWLPYHGYRYREHEKYGIIGWGRAAGWLMMGMSGCLNIVRIFESETQNDLDKNVLSDERTDLVTKRKLIRSDIQERTTKLKEYYDRLIDSVIRYQRADGLWGWNLTNDNSQIDTSASAMILYALSVYTPKDVGKKIQSIISKGISGIEKYITRDGRVMQCQAECGGFGIYPDKFGSYPWSVGMTLALLAVKGKNDDDSM